MKIPPFLVGLRCMSLKRWFDEDGLPVEKMWRFIGTDHHKLNYLKKKKQSIPRLVRDAFALQSPQ